VRYLTHLRFREKIRLSFGVLIALISINAIVAALAAYSIVDQIAQKDSVNQIVREIDQIRLTVGRYVNTLSRDAAQQVFQQVASTRQHIETTNHDLNSQHLNGMLPLLDDFKIHFQKYVVGADQTAALKSRAVDLGQRMVEQLNEARANQQTHFDHIAFDAVMGQILLLQWQEKKIQSPVPNPFVAQLASIRKGLARLRESGQSTGSDLDAQRMVFRILRDASDYVAGFESFEHYQRSGADTEKMLNLLSNSIEDRCNRVSVEVQHLIQTRIYTAVGLMMLIFAVSLVSAFVLNRYLTREILRPLLGLVNITHEISEGNLDAKAAVLVDDEIGELSISFNRMTESLKATQSELLEKHRSLEEAHDDLELRVKERTQQLAARELILRQILDTAPVSIFLVDMTGRITLANHCMVEMFGFPMNELIGMEYVALVDASELEIRRQRMQALMNCEIPAINLDRKFLRANGDLFWAHLTGRLLRGVAGEKLGLVGVIADITERKHAAEKLQLAANVFTHAREGIVITDANGTIIDANDTFTHITGYAREEVLGQNPRILKSGRQSAEFYGAMWTSLIERGSWSGEIWNRRKNGEVYPEMQAISSVRDEAGQTVNYVALFSDISEMKAHQKQLEQIAHYDALTGLPNRLLLADRLHQAMVQSQRRDNSLAVVFLDLDGFKAINDTHGHNIGDEVLVTVAQRMKAVLRDGDTLARIGGDEFVVLLTDLTHSHDCEPLLNRLLHAAGTPMSVVVKDHSVTLQVSTSAGVTLYPQDNADADLLMRHADQAMYAAKHAGKNRFHLFDLARDEAAKAQRESLAHIRRALDQQEFELFYQPKVNLHSGQVIGAEALIRWQHPERGLLAPVAFLPAIEDHPISIEVGEWVIATALGQVSAWRAHGLDTVVSVNISVRQLQEADFTTRLAQLLAAHPDVHPRCLQLEVLETSALEDKAQVGAAMNACHAIGVSFALDDFGTGYSSLSYLKHLPAQTLKIDQSFVRDMLVDPNDLAIVSGVIGLAKAFGREVIAEGVETPAHGALLLSIGCELAQGYGIARPMPPNELPGWVVNWQSSANWTA
jgi:diguanylate cyclase (GGDEF)-like protein/PAS domain S-box-containing protein